MSKVCLGWGLGEGVFPKDNSVKRNSPGCNELQMKLSRRSSSNRTGVVYFKLNFLSELRQSRRTLILSFSISVKNLLDLVIIFIDISILIEKYKDRGNKDHNLHHSQSCPTHCHIRPDQINQIGADLIRFDWMIN